MRRGRARSVCQMLLAVVAVVAVVSACGDARVVEPTAKDLRSDVKVSVTPDSGDKKVSVSTEIEVKSAGELTKVSLKNSKGEAVKGQLRTGSSSWLPDKPLDYSNKYTATTTVTDKSKRKRTDKTTFETMSKPDNTMEPALANVDGETFGKGMPVVIDFPNQHEVPKDKREAVEKRLFVSSEPHQPGAWHWFSGSHLEYRPQEFWEPGTEVTVRLGLKGIPLGDGSYGTKDINSTFTIDERDREIEVSNDDKELVAKEDGEEVKSQPVSLGKSGDESYSGTMAVMEKSQHTVFDTTDDPGCGGESGGDSCYRTPVDDAQRLTWSGQFIHSAPWSVGAQGSQNTSHGCVNVSPGDADWLMDFTTVGTPVEVTGTGVELPPGDGFGAFNLDWDEFVEGSYLPPPAATTN